MLNCFCARFLLCEYFVLFACIFAVFRVCLSRVIRTNSFGVFPVNKFFYVMFLKLYTVHSLIYSCEFIFDHMHVVLPRLLSSSFSGNATLPAFDFIPPGVTQLHYMWVSSLRSYNTSTLFLLLFAIRVMLIVLKSFLLRGSSTPVFPGWAVHIARNRDILHPDLCAFIRWQLRREVFKRPLSIFLLTPKSLVRAMVIYLNFLLSIPLNFTLLCLPFDLSEYLFRCWCLCFLVFPRLASGGQRQFRHIVAFCVVWLHIPLYYHRLHCGFTFSQSFLLFSMRVVLKVSFSLHRSSGCKLWSLPYPWIWGKRARCLYGHPLVLFYLHQRYSFLTISSRRWVTGDVWQTMMGDEISDIRLATCRCASFADCT